MDEYDAYERTTERYWDDVKVGDKLGRIIKGPLTPTAEIAVGPERCSWLIQGVTDWIGDNGMITMLDCQYRKFNYMGDVTWVQGEVQEKFERDGKAMVKVYVECVNHRDEVTAKGVAEAELARR